MITASLTDVGPARSIVIDERRVDFLHWTEPRSLAISEAKRLTSFPDAFTFEGSFHEQWARLGNCVPPLFMRAIAEHLRAEILAA